jgi:hypothetical protein
MKGKTENLFSKQQRIVSDKYREGYDHMFGKREIGCKECDKMVCICKNKSE